MKRHFVLVECKKVSTWIITAFTLIVRHFKPIFTLKTALTLDDVLHLDYLVLKSDK